jgi:hypothetical protein
MIQARPLSRHTIYNGQKYKSELEAKWARFFDILLIKFEYEPKDIDLPGIGIYRCDFRLPDQDCWVEIKGERPKKQEIDKALGLAIKDQHPVLMFCGDIHPMIRAHMAYPFVPRLKDRWSPDSFTWAQCIKCGYIDLIECEAAYPPRCRSCDQWTFCGPESNDLVKAYTQAANCRFDL